MTQTGAELIARERQRQVDECGWTAEHDDTSQDSGGLALAGVCYALDVINRIGNEFRYFPKLARILREFPTSAWPWDKEWFKPTPDDPVHQLVKAGALIAAEIDRLQRQSSHSTARGARE